MSDKTSNEAVAASTKYVKDHSVEIASGSREMVARLAFLEGVLWLTQRDLLARRRDLLTKRKAQVREVANAR